MSPRAGSTVLRPTRFRNRWRHRWWWLLVMYPILCWRLSMTFSSASAAALAVWLPIGVILSLVMLWISVAASSFSVEMGDGWVVYTNSFRWRRRWPASDIGRLIRRSIPTMSWGRRHVAALPAHSNAEDCLFVVDRSGRFCFALLLKNWEPDAPAVIARFCGLEIEGDALLITVADFDEQYPGVWPGWHRLN